MAKKYKPSTKATVWLDNGYKFELYIQDDIQESVSTDFRECIEKEATTFWLGNWGDAIEVHLYDPKGKHVEAFRESINEGNYPDIIIKQIVTYINI